MNDFFQLRYTIRERTDTLQSKDKELATLRKKEQNLHSTLESIQNKLDNESIKNKDLDGQVRNHQILSKISFWKNSS